MRFNESLGFHRLQPFEVRRAAEWHTLGRPRARHAARRSGARCGCPCRGMPGSWRQLRTRYRVGRQRACGSAGDPCPRRQVCAAFVNADDLATAIGCRHRKIEGGIAHLCHADADLECSPGTVLAFIAAIATVVTIASLKRGSLRDAESPKISRLPAIGVSATELAAEGLGRGWAARRLSRTGC
jgi:hypothetical protein